MTRAGAFIILIALVCGAPLKAQTESSANSSATPLLLQGGVEHSERLPPVAPQLRPGIPFSESLLPQLQPNNDWFLLPDWLVGTWQQTEQTVLSQRDFKTGAFHNKKLHVPSRSSFTEGFQKDRLGGIWQFKNVPSTTKVDGGLFQEYHITTGADWLTDQQDKLVVRTRYTAVKVNMSTWQIDKVCQREDIQTNTPAGHGKVRAEFSSKEFDENGLPAKLTKSFMILKRSADFSPVDVLDGRDMRRMFKDFLNSHGLKDNLPTGAVYPDSPSSRGASNPATPLSSSRV